MMASFSVSFEPSIPVGGIAAPPSDPDWSAIWQAVKDRPEYDMTFNVCGHDFGYYPSDLMTVLGDIIEEISHLEQGLDHVVSMSGYTILRAEIDGDQVVFIDPCLPPTWRYEVPMVEVRAALVAASKDVWSLITDGATSLPA